MSTTLEQLIHAAQLMDWGQVVANGGPPCFHYQTDEQRFCGRAARWVGHDAQAKDIGHQYVPFSQLVATVAVLSQKVRP